MNSSKKKNRNEDSSDEEYVVSEFSYVSTSSSNDHGNATVSIGDAQGMRESFRTHFNAVAFGFFNENAGSGTTPVNAETASVNNKTVRPNSFAVLRPTAPKILSMTYHFLIDHKKTD